MNVAEEALATEVYAAIQQATNYSPRGQQAREFKVGCSDLGFCSERTKRMLQQKVPEDRDMLPAFIGTAIGDHVEAACAAIWPDAITQASVNVTLTGDGGVYNVGGHPDLLRPTGLVVDFKTSRSLVWAEKRGASQQQNFQRHCYAKGAWQGGFFPGVPLADVMVANVWIDRAGDDRRCHVQMEPYDETVVEAAADWLDGVIYAYVHDQEARKEPAREICQAACGFYATCRALDTDVEGLLTDEGVLASVGIYQEGALMEKQGKKMKEQAKANLADINGSTGEFAVRWVWKNGGPVAFERKGGYTLDIRPMR